MFGDSFLFLNLVASTADEEENCNWNESSNYIFYSLPTDSGSVAVVQVLLISQDSPTSEGMESWSPEVFKKRVDVKLRDMV